MFVYKTVNALHSSVNMHMTHELRELEEEYFQNGCDDLLDKAKHLGIETKAPRLLAQLFFDERILRQIKLYTPCLLSFTRNNKKAQINFLKGLEDVITLHREVLLDKVPGLLKVLYDLNIIWEEAIFKWTNILSHRSDNMSQHIYKKAATFVNWLEETESSESSDSEYNCND